MRNSRSIENVWVFLFSILIKNPSKINLHYCSTCVREGAVRTTQQQKNFVNQEHTHIFRVTSVGLTSHSSCETVTLVFLTNLTAHSEELFEKNSFVHSESRIRLGKATVHFKSCCVFLATWLSWLLIIMSFPFFA